MEAVLESYLNDFCKTFNFSRENSSVQFEHFCNYVIIPKLEDTKEAIESVNVGGDGNPGIDGMVVVFK